MDSLDFGREDIVFLDIIVFKLNQEISGGGMIEYISEESDSLFKRKVLILELELKKVAERSRRFNKFSNC